MTKVKKTKETNSLKESLIKNSSIKLTEGLAESKIFNDKDESRTSIPALNVALSGELGGGMTSGLCQLCGPSKHFKSNIGLIMVAGYLNKYKDAVCIFMDSEFGITNEYLEAAGIDPERVIHTPIKHIEELKFETVNQLSHITRGQKVIFFVDSVGNLASLKETEDAENQKSVADMSRAKALKSCFRIITPNLVIKNIPMVVINHVYQETGMFAKTVVSGGTGIYLSSSEIFIIGRAQEKEGTEVVGYNFTINIEKSRRVQEKKKIPINVTWNGGVNPFSGIFEWAEEFGFIASPKQGYYQIVDRETGELVGKKFRKKELQHSKDDLLPIMRDKDFQDLIANKYKLKPRDVDTELNKELDTFFSE